MGSNVLFGKQCLSPCNSAMHTIDVQCSSGGGLMNINISQCEREAFSCLEVTMGSFATSWTIACFAFGVILIDQPLLGMITTVLNFLHLYTSCLTVDLWSLNSLEMFCNIFHPDEQQQLFF